jgi:hypothetical protein
VVLIGLFVGVVAPLALLLRFVSAIVDGVAACWGVLLSPSQLSSSPTPSLTASPQSSSMCLTSRRRLCGHLESWRHNFDDKHNNAAADDNGSTSNKNAVDRDDSSEHYAFST